MKTHLYRQLARLRPLVSRFAERREHEGLLPSKGELTGLSGLGTRADFDRHLAATAMVSVSDPLRDPSQELARKFPVEPRRRGESAPLLDLQQRLQLDPVEYAALVATIAPVIVPSYGRLFAYLRNDLTLSAAGLTLILGLFEWETRAHAAQLLETVLHLPQSKLIQKGLIRVELEGSPQRDRIWPSRRLLELLTAGPKLSQTMADHMTLEQRPTVPADLVLPEATLNRVRELRGRFDGHDVATIVLNGSTGVGKTTIAHCLAGVHGRPVLKFNLRLLGSLAELLQVSEARALKHVLNEATILGAVPLLTRVGAALGSGEPRHEQLRLILGRHEGLLLLSTRETSPHLGDLQGAEHLPVGMPQPKQRLALWNRFLPPARRHPALDIGSVALHYKISGGRIQRVAQAALARATATMAPHVDLDMLSVALRGVVQHGLGDIASVVRNVATWDDLVLPTATEIQLRSIVARFRNRRQVLQEWGLARVRRSAAITALFKGPPGTGKSMAASVLGREMGLDVYRLDLSRVIDKYIGETEKRLEVAFSEAEASGAILFFDEADSLFGKRTSVSNANDQHANTKVNFLLQRMDTFDGIIVLATNHASHLDQAFKRRIAFHVDFPEPGER